MAAIVLDPIGARGAAFEDLGHPLQGVSRTARKLVAKRVLDTDASALSELLKDSKPHLRNNALLLAARLSHWLAAPLILRGTRDPAAEVADAAGHLLEKWLARHFHGVYAAPEPSDTQKRELRVEMDLCGAALSASTMAKLTRAMAGEPSS